MLAANKCEVPSKTFIVGEYAVLAHHEAIVLTHPPHFIFSISPAKHFSSNAYPEIEEKLANLGNWHWQMQDPHQQNGGFGASSAWLVAYQKLGQLPLETIIAAQRQLSPNSSAADVIAQSHGGLCWINTRTAHVQSLSMPALAWQIIKTPFKVRTDDHLSQLESISSHQLALIVKRCHQALISGNRHAFIDCVNAYEAELTRLKLDYAPLDAIKDKLKRQPGVLALKGCGALGADVLFVVHEPGSDLKLPAGYRQICDHNHVMGQ